MKYRLRLRIVEALLSHGTVFLPEELEWVGEWQRFRNNGGDLKSVGAVEAVYWGGIGYQHPSWLTSKIADGWVQVEMSRSGKVTMLIRNGTAHVRAEVGDYLIQGLNGSVYTCSRLLFKRRYERA